MPPESKRTPLPRDCIIYLEENDDRLFQDYTAAESTSCLICVSIFVQKFATSFDSKALSPCLMTTNSLDLAIVNRILQHFELISHVVPISSSYFERTLKNTIYLSSEVSSTSSYPVQTSVLENLSYKAVLLRA